MALNIPNTGPAINTLLTGVDTGSSMFSRLMQPVIERERMKQQQNQFAQNFTLQKQAQDRANALMPYMIQQYQDTHKTAASEAQMKNIYRGLIQDALQGGAPTDNASPGGQPSPAPGVMPPQMGGMSPEAGGAAPQVSAGEGASNSPQSGINGEYELRAGNPRLSKLDRVAGLVPLIPKPVQHISNGVIFTTYPSGRMTAQQVPGSHQTPGQKNVSAKEGSKLRDQATALANSANLVQQGYDILDSNPDLTGIGSGLAEKFNMSSNPELGKFTSVSGKLQAELGKYASQRGGIQAVKWAQSVKPSSWKPQDYNYGMFEGIEKNLRDDYNTLNQQYKAATGENLPIPLPQMKRSDKSSGAGAGSGNDSGKGKVTKWKMKGGQLVKE